MIKCQNLSEEDINRIGAQVAEAFLAEDGFFAVLPMDVAKKIFAVIIKTCYDSGHLYTTSENQEGFCVYWSKSERPGFMPQLKMMIKFAKILSFKQSIDLLKMQNDWTPTEKRYKKNKDYMEVFLLAVRKEYQGQGYFRKILEEVFEIAEKKNTICVLDTDAKLKAEKYSHVGMKIVDHKLQKSGIEMFALEK